MAKAPRSNKKSGASGTAKTDKKAAIVQAALSLFTQHGVAETKMKQVAELAGVDQPLIHYYFSDPDLLLMEVIDLAAVDLTVTSTDASNRETDPVLIMKQYLVDTMRWTHENPGSFAMWIYFYYLATFNPKFTTLNQRYRKEGRDRIALFIYKGLERGSYKLPAHASVADIAMNIQGLLTGNAIMAATEGTVNWEWFLNETVKRCFDMLGVQSIP